RPSPPIDPEVYSRYRQALCEALPYFNAYQSSLYSSHCRVRGFLVDKETEARDYLGSQVIITSCGGGRTRDDATNSMVRTADHNPDSVVIRSVLKTMEEKTPVGSYCVLDWFIITDVWSEKMKVSGTDAVVTVFKIRFKKVDKNKVSWWAPPESDFDGLIWDQFRAGFPPCNIQTCASCGKPSKEIYSAGWTCLHHDCPTHFHFVQDNTDISKLKYSNSFLAERSQFDTTTAPLRPSIPSLLEDYHGTEKLFRKGIVCPDCGLCSSRIYWNRWTCERVQHGNLTGCGNFQLATPMKVYPKEALRADVDKFQQRMNLRRKSNNLDANFLAANLNGACIQSVRSITLGGYQGHQFFLPDQQGKIIGSVTVFAATANINSRVGGPDEMWQDISEADLGLRRNPVALAGRKAQGLTRHFTHNFGAPYKFGVAVQSSGFDSAPECVLKALHRLDWAAKMSVDATTEMISQLPHAGNDSPPSERQQYNELLVLGYMTDDEIRYHDDGESQLGPTVATLSLGCPALMRFRPKASAKFPTSLVAQTAKGCLQDILQVPIEHGDMVVMHGALQHAVKPFGPRRFAMTCRYIDPDTMTNEAEINATLTKGAIPADSYKWAYDG
ncbi:hypothetical protein GQ53DRAFT_599597, partial [Thozetella sp. PMI_491]